MNFTGKFYLVDCGYANTDDFLALYQGRTYHIEGFSRQTWGIRYKEDVFKYTHSSLRTMVERTFWIWKSRFTILKKHNRYSIKKQAMVPIACVVLHNFMKQEKVNDTFDNTGEVVPHVGEGSSSRRGACPKREVDYDVSKHIAVEFSQEARVYMVRVRDEIVNQM